MPFRFFGFIAQVLDVDYLRSLSIALEHLRCRQHWHAQLSLPYG